MSQLVAARFPNSRGIIRISRFEVSFDIPPTARADSAGSHRGQSRGSPNGLGIRPEKSPAWKMAACQDRPSVTPFRFLILSLGMWSASRKLTSHLKSSAFGMPGIKLGMGMGPLLEFFVDNLAHDGLDFLGRFFAG